MSNKVIPWDDIRQPDKDYNVRLVPGGGLIPLYWGRDSDGRCLLIIELDGDNTNELRHSDIAVLGIEVDLRHLDSLMRQGLVLTLEHQVDRDLFHALCQTLIYSLQQVSSRSEALGVALIHIKRWKIFLAGRKSRLLSNEEIRGLFGELHFLRLLCNKLPLQTAIDAWCGPNGSHQDFIFGNTAVETKTISGRERSTVLISSEDQLESTCDRLFISIYRLSEMPDADLAISLNDLVRIIESELAEPAILEDFRVRIGAYGYVDIKEYDTPKLIVSSQQIFEVDHTFPRIIRSGLPSGVVKVGYEIQLEKIEAFKRTFEQIWEV